jgi:hypothetical protein
MPTIKFQICASHHQQPHGFVSAADKDMAPARFSVAACWHEKTTRKKMARIFDMANSGWMFCGRMSQFHSMGTRESDEEKRWRGCIRDML